MDIYEGTYHASVSLYMHGRCRVNFGKTPFAYKPRSEPVVNAVKKGDDGGTVAMK